MLLTAIAALLLADPQPIIYTISFPDRDSKLAHIEAFIPAAKATSIELFLPVWSPGFYHQEDYAAKIRDLSAKLGDGSTPQVEQTAPNRWRIATSYSPELIVTYSLLCDRKFVTTNWVGPEGAILNGPATFITTIDHRRPYEVIVDLPPQWKQVKTGLAADQPNRFVAPSYEALLDCPIAAGNFDVREFQVGASRHELVSIGDLGPWKPERPVEDLRRIVTAARDMWGWKELPFDHYVFLFSFGPGGGGLEHCNSTLITCSPTGMETDNGYHGWLGLVSHEYFHAFNVKRLRPVELGPFDYEQPPKTSSLWISEGLTNYYGDLTVRRAGLSTDSMLLRQISGQIGQLQKSPGRLLQTLSQSSADVWTSSTSGVRNDPAKTISYYVKGPVVGFLLDARIRHATNGAKSLDDVMRLAYDRYSGPHGFTPEEFRACAEEVLGADLKDWFHRALDSTEELDYTEALDYFGLRFAPPDESGAQSWKLEPRPDATDSQKSRLSDWAKTTAK